MTHSPLAMTLTSMALPEAPVAPDSVALTLSQADVLLHPGKRAELLITLENLSDRPLVWRMEIQGNFPTAGDQFSQTNWCNWQTELLSDATSLSELLPHQRIVRAIAFQIPADFFEHQHAISHQQPQLQLDYQGQIRIYLRHTTDTLTTSQQLVEEKPFSLFVRPDSAYLNFLPSFYRDVDFTGRFLSIFEQGFDPAVQAIDTLWAYLDPLTAPEALLPFLAHWVAWTLDPRWDIAQQRRLIRHAMTLYRWHGTRWGLRFYLHLYTGLPLEHISIEETYCQGLVLNHAELGQETILGGGRPYHFVVRLRTEEPDYLEKNELLIREIIEHYKPAFCSYDLVPI